MRLRDFDSARFLRETWQRRPLLLRNAWERWDNPLTPDELAGLACEDDVEARLITGGRTANDWQLERGPFAEDRFAAVPPSHWTLLVQAVDHWLPEVAALIEPFRFVPDWRIDDVMVSYAANGGSVGPHFDQYDVFLIQGLGRRRWQIGDFSDAATPQLAHPQLRLLAQFEARDEWILEPGDILYLPPRLAHYGVALDDDCMTYSVGFRAPGRAELISHWCDHVLETVGDDDRYTDSPAGIGANPGEITPAALAQLRRMVLEQLGDEDAFRRWFGTWVTTPKYSDHAYAPERLLRPRALRAGLERCGALLRNPASRFAFAGGADVLLFVDGHSYAGDADFIAWLCTETRWSQEALAPWLTAPANADLLCRLFNQGSVYFDEPDD